MDSVGAVLDLLLGIPTPLLYLVLALGGLVENLVPPVPADTFVVVGGLLAARGDLSPLLLLTLIWLFNVGGALLVYAMGFRYGAVFFETGMGRLLLNRRQLERLSRFYRRWGATAIFLARFLPGLRAVVPAFAGVSHMRVWRVALPLGTASAIWYGALMWAGFQAGRNVETLERWLGGANRGLLIAALVAAAAVAVWWVRSRRAGDGDDGPGPPGRELDG